MSTMYGDQTPQPGPVQWHAAPPVTPTEHVPIDQPAAPATAALKANRGKIAAGDAALLIAVGGTITAIGNGTVTIKLTSGTTTTYTVTSSTRLWNNGAAVALSSFTVGTSVRGSTTTQGGTTLNDMVTGDFRGGARNGTPPQGTAGTGTGTTGSST
jgi:hypothetical protein